MRKFILVLILITLSVAIGIHWDRSDGNVFDAGKRKQVLLRVALVTDSENENELLETALSQAKGAGVNFVIGLGDWSSVGTIEELIAAKFVFDESGLVYYVIPGDHDLWASRNEGNLATTNFRSIFGDPTQAITEDMIQFVLLDNSDIYAGIKDAEISNFKFLVSNSQNKLTFVFAHKTPFHL